LKTTGADKDRLLFKVWGRGQKGSRGQEVAASTIAISVPKSQLIDIDGTGSLATSQGNLGKKEGQKTLYSGS